MIRSKIFMTVVADTGLGYETEGVTLAGTQYSRRIATRDVAEGPMVHLDWTGTPTSNVTLWGSNKDSPNEASDADWVQDTDWGSAGTLALGGAAGKYAKKLSGTFRWYRVKSILSAGSGAIKGWAVTPQGV